MAEWIVFWVGSPVQEDRVDRVWDFGCSDLRLRAAVGPGGRLKVLREADPELELSSALSKLVKRCCQGLVNKILHMAGMSW